VTTTTAPPPQTPIEPVTEMLHGVRIADPYRWLEEQDSLRTRTWLKEQTSYTREILDAIPSKNRIRQRIKELLNVEFVSEPWKVGDYYFFLKRAAHQQQPVIMMRRSDFEPGEDICLVDPVQRQEGAATSVGLLAISDDAKLMAYSVRHGGEDAYSVEFMDVETRRILPDRLPHGLCFGLIFYPERTGFYYSHSSIEKARSSRQSVCRHLFGTPLDQDIELFFIEDGENRRLTMFPAMGGRTLVYLVSSLQGPRLSDIYVHDLAGGRPPCAIATQVEGHFNLYCVGNRLIALTDWKAPNFRVLEISLESLTRESWREIIPESEHRIYDLAIAGEALFISYIENCRTRIDIFDRSGQRQGHLACPEDSTIDLLSWWPSDDTLFYQLTSYAKPPETHAYNASTGKSTIWARSNVPFDSSAIEITRTTYPSKDGTQIPISLVGRREYRDSSPRPTFLTGYGGFGASIVPRFAVYAAFLIEHGFLFAVANLRGGSELGAQWHLAGKRHQRQNAIDDFVAAAEWLVQTGHTTPKKLAIGGGSNAGLLVAAALTQRPDLFRAVLCLGPLLDMLRYHKFDLAAWFVEEYGSSENEDDFRALYAYSPYHRVRAETAYPSVMFISGDADHRCNPMHARKMTARLQAATTSGHPILLDYKQDWGHWPAQSLDLRVAALTDRLSFICHELGVTV
jgi:prolyl oligopeptidase